jgi:hypothetical protein
MRATFRISCLLFVFSNATTALKSGIHCFGGCELTLAYADFNDTVPGLFKKIKICQSVLHATLLYLCFTEHCVEKGRDTWLRASNDTCQRTANETLLSWDIISNWTAKDVAHVRRFRADEGMWNSKHQLLTPLHLLNTTLFIVGGTGIAVPLSYLKSLLAESSTARTIHIVWVVRDDSFVTDIAERDLKRYVSDGRFRLTVHVTQDEEMKNGISYERGGVSGMERITLKAGRPDVDAAVREAAEEAGTSGSLAVMACGPAQMADDARRACVRALGRGYRGIAYFEESFKW